MSNENPATHDGQKNNSSFGAKLKAAREALQMERAEVAKQLRLNERIIVLMEKDRYSPDLPITFVRGYIRAYAKFLQIPEYEVKKALEHINYKTTLPTQIKPLEPLSTGNYFVRSFTYLVFFSVVSLTVAWWYNQNHGFLPHQMLTGIHTSAPKILANNTINSTTPNDIKTATEITPPSPPVANTSQPSSTKNSDSQEEDMTPPSAQKKKVGEEMEEEVE